MFTFYFFTNFLNAMSHP